MTLVVNMYGGPGVGKSTLAAMVFGRLKEAGVNAELVTEFAKDLVWENRRVIRCRPFVFGEQLWRIERLLDRVDVVVTDSPLLMDLAYSSHLGPHWAQVVWSQHKKLDSLNILLTRHPKHPYRSEGRLQSSLDEALVLDGVIRNLLSDFNVPHIRAEVHSESAREVTELVLNRLDPERAGKEDA